MKAVLTSRDLNDYTVTLKYVEGSFWQGQLVELPGVISFSYGWSSLKVKLQDALELYQTANIDCAGA